MMKKLLLISLMITALIFTFVNPNCQAQVDYSTQDILGENGHTYPVYDLAVSQASAETSTLYTSIYPTYQTDTDTVTEIPLGDPVAMPGGPMNISNAAGTYPACRARLTKEKKDYLVTVAPSTESATGFMIYIQGLDDQGQAVQQKLPLDWDAAAVGNVGNTPNPRAVTAGDFNNDSLDEIAIIFYFDGGLYIMIAEPIFRDALPVGAFIAGAVARFTDYNFTDPARIQTPHIYAVNGDFNGDGFRDVAVYDWQGDGVWFLSIDPQALEAVYVSVADSEALFGVPGTIGDTSLQTPLQGFIAGDFDTDPSKDELVGLRTSLGSSSTNYDLYALKFQQTSNNTEISFQVQDRQIKSIAKVNTADWDAGVADFYVALPQRFTHARIDEGDPYTLFAIAITTESCSSFGLPYKIYEAKLNADFIFNIGEKDGVGIPINTPAYGAVNGEDYGELLALVAGRFGPMSEAGQYAVVWDHLKPSSNNEDINLGVLVLLTLKDDNGTVYELSSIKTLSPYELPGPHFSGAQSPRLIVGDFQGRSIELEQVGKLTINNHTQPYIVLGAPPMHIDYIGEKDGTGKSTPTNMTAFPADFNAAYAFTDANNSDCSVSGSTSYAFATKEEVNGAITFGVPLIDEIKINLKNVVKNKWENALSSDEKNMTSASLDASTQTGWGDHIWFNHTSHYFWIYNVTGETATAKSDGLGHPLCMVFSASPMTTHTHINGSMVEWYQPVHEPGNMFSYPSSYENLAARLSNGAPLTDKDSSWYTGDDTSVVTVKWQQGWTNDSSASNSNYYSNDRSLSASGKTTFEGVGVSAGASYESSKDSSASSSRSNGMTLDQTTGITITKAGKKFTDSDNYSYEVGAVVFGSEYNDGVLDKRTPENGGNTTPGPITLGFWANPMADNSGNYWVNSGNWYLNGLPDIALNHPQRYSYSAPEKEDVITFNQKDDSIGPLQSFFLMRGFFITTDQGLNDPNEQIQNGTVFYVDAGKTVNLVARVYNYSFVDSQENGQQIKAAFYRQPHYPQNNSFGDTLTRVGEIQTVSNIYGFDPSNNLTKNYDLISVKMDTTGLLTSDEKAAYFVFWVVVWLEDGNDVVGGEIEEHGLTKAPGETIKTTKLGLPLFEGVESFSNNIGVFKIPLCVTNVSTSTAQRTLANGNTPNLTIESLTVSPRNGSNSDIYNIIAEVKASNGDHGTTHVYFYIGDPNNGGRCIDVETIPYLSSGETYKVLASCSYDECRDQKIYIMITGHDQAVMSASATVLRAPSGSGGCFIQSAKP